MFCDPENRTLRFLKKLCEWVRDEAIIICDASRFGGELHKDEGETLSEDSEDEDEQEEDGDEEPDEEPEDENEPESFELS